MPAMHDEVYSAMCDTLEHRKNVFLRTLPFHMTHEECIRLVAPPEHVEMLTKVSEYADISASEQWMMLKMPANIDGCDMPEVQLFMRTYEQKAPPLRPRTPYWQSRTELNRAAGEKVIAWMEKRLEIGRRFGTARHVLFELSRLCESGQQVRYMFPAVLHLCRSGRSTRVDKWVEKFSAFKVCKHTPAVSPELKRAIQDASALLTSVALLGDDVPEPDPSPVCIAPYDMPRFMIGDNSVARL